MQPVSIGERLLHIKEAKRRLGTAMPWLADSMGNELKHAFGDRNNSEFVIGADGKVVVARTWSDPDALRGDLERLVGAVEKPTRVADLDRVVKRGAGAEKIRRGIVPRLERPEGLVTLKTRPKLDAEKDKAPFYVKLRAEAKPALLSGGKGQLLLGFHLDPIHHVHWNNLAAPLKFSIAGKKAEPSSGQAAKIEAETDLDPREFLVSLDGVQAGEKLLLNVDYFACHNDEGWCKAVSQQYEIVLERDPDAGRVMGGRAGGRPPRGGGGGPPRGGFDAASIVARIMESDKNGDGKLTKQEAPERMAERFEQMDADKDGFVDKAEIEARFKRRPPGGGGGGGQRPRGGR